MFQKINNGFIFFIFAYGQQLLKLGLAALKKLKIKLI
jgi:hypothetical protein